MGSVRARGEEIRRYIIDHVAKHPTDISRAAQDRFGISRQAVNKHLRGLVRDGFLLETGRTRDRAYTLAKLAVWRKSFALPGTAEDVVWRDDVAPALGELPDNVRNIWNYGFTEMFNNALEHSEGREITVKLTKTAASTSMMVMDDGIGIFRKIQTSLGLLDERHAILELSKGKLTTDPSRHSGQGIFFTSRMFDDYVILSRGVTFTHQVGHDEDWVIERDDDGSGTTVFLELSNHTARTAKKVFDQFTSDDGNYRFDKTVVPVKLARYGNDELISRSQAKRLLTRFESFKIVLLDFKDVTAIGQAFADEIFRVFCAQHPEVSIEAMHASADVKRMIERARSGSTTRDEGPPEASAPTRSA